MKQLLQAFKIRDILFFAIMAIAFLPGKIWKAFNQNIWVITEYPDAARDNGYWIFKYLRENDSSVSAYYPIKRSSSDYKKIQPLGHAVEFGSFKHYLLFWAATKYLGTTKWHAFPDQRTGIFFQLRNLTGFRYVFLNHGVARGFSKIVCTDETNYDMVIAASEKEKKIIVKYNKQKPENVYALGFCRHDNLNNNMLEKNLILFMPTWRSYLDLFYEEDAKVRAEHKKHFTESEYYQMCQKVISDPEIINFLERNDLKLCFYLHSFAQEYADYFIPGSTRVTIAKKEDFFVQDLLKRAVFLITDYSSVIFDFAYMKKACAYFQYDLDVFEKTQYAQSEDYTYERDGFGPVYKTFDELMSGLEESLNNHFVMKEKYRKRVDAFFPSFDNKHCERTVEAIKKHVHF